MKAEPFGEPGYFFEAPRWHNARWWTSDQRGGVVRSFDMEGKGRDELRLADDRPSGLGWMPDGSLLVVGMEKRQILRLGPGRSEAELHCDLSAHCRDLNGFLNDMVVDADGRAYVGFDPDFGLYGPGCEEGLILVVAPEGVSRIAADGLMYPNGMVIDDGTLIVAETTRSRFSSFAIKPEGSLGPRRVWGDTKRKEDRRSDRSIAFGPEDFGLDGCDIDSEGYIWAADFNSGCFRFAPGGAVMDSVHLPANYHAWACAIGGNDGRTLLICGADMEFSRRMERPAARLFTARLSTAGRSAPK